MVDLSYLNARLRGWRSGLFKKEDYDAFIESESIEDYMDLLRHTGYGPDIGVAGARYERAYDILSSALRSNLSKSFQSLWEKTPTGARTYLKALFSTWEVYNIKALLRGIDRGVSREELFEALVPVGELDLPALKELIRSKDINDLLRLFRTWGSPYAAPLIEGLLAYQRHHSLIEMELRLDIFSTRFFASTISSRSMNGKVIRAMLADRVDAQNIMTLMKAAGEGYSEGVIEGYFMEGGRRLRRREFLRLSGLTSREELLTALPEVIKDVSWRKVLYLAGTEDMDLIEELFEDLHRKALSRSSIEGPLSIALGAAFIHAKIREVKNLRIIARGKLFSIPEDELKRVLIF
jgi:V/A-type H+-transporting ATPase subunit C